VRGSRKPAGFVCTATCLAALCGAAGGQEALEGRIGRLLTEARAAPSVALAETKIRQAEKLLADQAGTLDQTDRAFLRADILRSRGRVGVIAWQRDPTDAKLRTGAGKHLTEAVETYGRLVKACEDRLDQIEVALGSRDPSKNEQWRRFNGLVSRANYCEAWSRYNLGLLAADEKQRQERLGKAIELFSSFTAAGYRKHAIVADCFLGQALCLYEQRHYFRVLELLKPARPENTPPAVFKRMTYLRIKAGQAYHKYYETEQSAKQYFDALPAGHKLDAVELGMAVERARCLAVLADAKRNPEYYKLFRGRLDEVSKTIYRHGEPWRTELAKALGKSTDATPFGCLTRARASFTARKFDEAADWAEKGIAAAGAETEAAVLGDLRYALAAARLNGSQWLKAYQAAERFLVHHAADRRAATVVNSGLQAGLKAMKADPPLPPERFGQFLAMLRQQFPTHAEVRKLPWYQAQLALAAGRFDRAEQLLTAVPAGSPIYLEAQYGLALAAAKQAEPLIGKPDAAKKAVVLLDRAAAAIGRFLAAAGKAPVGDKQLIEAAVGVAVTAARWNLQLAAPRPAEALRLLDRLDATAAVARRAGARRLAIRVQALVASGRMAEAAGHVDQMLLASSAGKGAAADTLAQIAQPLSAEVDRLLSAGQTDAAKRLGRQVAEIHDRLLRHVQQSEEASIRSQEPAAREQLAALLVKLDRPIDALPHYKWLTEKTPRAKAGRAMRGLADCYERTRQYTLAAGQWGILARGLKKDTEPWYEARYHWIWCLHKQGESARARKVMRYFRLQHPTIASGPWRQRFDELSRRLAEPATQAATMSTR